jgi:probable F420-dependent oxidoreductase
MPKHPRRFRFGVQISKTRPASEWREQARRAEALGYDVFLMPDHVGAQLAIGPALAVVAEATAMRIGTLVWQNDWRHPALLAKEAYTLDLLSDGRFELGIGAGGSFPPEFDWLGIPMGAPRDRVSRLEESLQILKGVACDGPFSFEGEHYTISDYEGHPKPVQQPHPPILIGAGGPRMIRIAAHHADIIGLLPSLGGETTFDLGEIGPEAFEAKVARIRDIAGPRFDEIELNILVQGLAVTDDRTAGIQRLREARGFDRDEWFDSPMVFVGSVEQIVERMQAQRERLGVSYYVVFEHEMEALAPVVARLAGS